MAEREPLETDWTMPCTTIAALTLMRLAIMPIKTRPPAMPKSPEMIAQSPAERIIIRPVCI